MEQLLTLVTPSGLPTVRLQCTQPRVSNPHIRGEGEGLGREAAVPECVARF
jgi:hypothetical protein